MASIISGVLLISSLLGHQPVDIQQISPGTAVCYGTAYSDAHMSKHPLQTVKAMSVQVWKISSGKGSAVRLNVRAEVKRPAGKSFQYGTYDTEMICDLEGHRLVCGVECDGGMATLRWNPSRRDGAITFINQSFVVSGGCSQQKSEEVVIEARRGGDDVFRLKPMPAEICSLH